MPIKIWYFFSLLFSFTLEKVSCRLETDQVVLKGLNSFQWLIRDFLFFLFTRCGWRYCGEHHPGVQYQTIVSRKIFTDESACFVCTYLVIVLALLLLLLMPLSSSPLLSPDFASACISLAVSAARNDNIVLSDNCYHALSWKKETQLTLRSEVSTTLPDGIDLNRTQTGIISISLETKARKALIPFLLPRGTIKLFRNRISFQCQRDNSYCRFA